MQLSEISFQKREGLCHCSHQPSTDEQSWRLKAENCYTYEKLYYPKCGYRQ